MSIIIDENTRLIVQGITGNEGLFHTRQMVEYGTKIVGGVTPGKGGQAVDGIPVFNTVASAAEETGANTSVIFVPPAFSADAVMEAADAGLKTIVCMTEGIPTIDMMQVKLYLEGKGINLIGPNTPGIISPGEKGHEGDVLAFRLVRGELFLEQFRNPGVLGKHEDAGDAAVEPVYDLHAPQLFAAEADVALEVVHERVRLVLRCRHGQHVRRLFNHQKIFILMDEPERGVAARPRFFRIVLVRVVADNNLVARHHRLKIRFARRAIDGDAAVIHQAANLRTGAGGERLNNLVHAPDLFHRDGGFLYDVCHVGNMARQA